jgi:hypothetical protein
MPAPEAAAAPVRIPSGTVGFRLRPSLIHGNRFPVEIAAVEFFDRLLGAFLRLHLYEAEAPRNPGELILDDGHGCNRPGLGKVVLQVFLCDFLGQVPYIQIFVHGSPPNSFRNTPPS